MGLHRSVPAPPSGDSHDGRVPGNGTPCQGQLSASAATSITLSTSHYMSSGSNQGAFSLPASFLTVPLADPSPGQPTSPPPGLAEGRRACPPHWYLIPSTDRVKGPILIGVCVFCGDEKPHPREPRLYIHGRPTDWHRKGQGDDA